MKNVQQTHLRSGIAGKIRALRWDRHWTQVELARKLGLSQGRYSEIERGQGSFTAEQFLEMLKLFQVPVSHFSELRKGDGPETSNAPVRFGARRAGILKAVQPPGAHPRKSATNQAMAEDDPADPSVSSSPMPVRRTARSLSNSLEMDWD